MFEVRVVYTVVFLVTHPATLYASLEPRTLPSLALCLLSRSSRSSCFRVNVRSLASPPLTAA